MPIGDRVRPGRTRDCNLGAVGGSLRTGSGGEFSGGPEPGVPERQAPLGRTGQAPACPRFRRVFESPPSTGEIRGTPAPTEYRLTSRRGAMAIIDYYAVLGVPSYATSGQIRRAYRALAFRWHPDRNAGREAEAHDRFVAVQQAFDVLSDSRRRFEYDEQVRRQGVRPAPRPARSSGFGHERPRPERPRNRRPAGAAPKAAPPPRKPLTVRTLVSRIAWVPLSFVLRSIGVLFLLVIGNPGNRAPDRWEEFRARHAGAVGLLRVAQFASAVIFVTAFLFVRLSLPSRPLPPPDPSGWPTPRYRHGRGWRLDEVLESSSDWREVAVVAGAVFIAALVIDRLIYAYFWATDAESRRHRTE